MRVEYLNPFVASVTNTFRTMLGCELHRGPVTLGHATTGRAVSGIIGLSGQMAGMCVVGLCESVALKAASAMLMCPCGELNADVTDAVGEIANMVAGAAKAQLEQHHLSISLPSVVIGDSYKVSFPSSCQPVCVPFTCEWGEVWLEVGMAAVASPELTTTA